MEISEAVMRDLTSSKPDTIWGTETMWLGQGRDTGHRWWFPGAQTEKERAAASSSQFVRGLVEVVFKKAQVEAREAEAEVCCVCPEDNSMDGTER